MEDLLQRVASLESASRKVNEELMSIQEKNILLQKDVLKAQRDKHELKEQYDALQAGMTRMKRTIEENQQVKDEPKRHDAVQPQANVALTKDIKDETNLLKDKIKQMDTVQTGLVDEVKQLKVRLQQLDAVQADVTQLKQWADDNKDLKVKLKKMEAVQADVDRMKQKTDDNKQWKDTSKQLNTVKADVALIKKQKTDDNALLKDKLKQIENVKADVSLMKQKVNEIKQLKDKFKKYDDLNGEVTNIKKEVADLDKDWKAKDQTTSDRMAQLGNFQRVLSRAMAEAHRDDDDVRKEVTKVSNTLTRRLSRLEKRAAEEKESEVRVFMDTSTLRLITGQGVKIDKSNGVAGNVGGCFDASSCRVRTKVSGRYLINVLSWQTGAGKIWIWVKSDKGHNVAMGYTTGDNTSQVSTIVLDFDAQENLWLEVERVDGVATLDFCWLYVRLLQSDD